MLTMRTTTATDKVWQHAPAAPNVNLDINIPYVRPRHPKELQVRLPSQY